MTKDDVKDVLDTYEVKILELPLVEQKAVADIHEAMQRLVRNTGKQGRLASGLFAFNILLEHFDVEPNT